jgi:hypothetical protein
MPGGHFTDSVGLIGDDPINDIDISATTFLMSLVFVHPVT